MHRSIACSFLLLFTLSLTAIRAQDTVPWPPDPADIFAPGVEVVSVEEIDLPPPESAVPPTADDEVRIVTAYNPATETLMEYPYPDEVTVLSNGIRHRSDGNIVFNVAFSDNSPPDWPSPWILNPITGAFSPAEIVCGGRVKELPGEGVWIINLPENVLCFTETGELSASLPADVSWQNYWGALPQLEDAAWLTLIGYAGDNGEQIVIYSYDVSAQQYLFLGAIPYDMLSVDAHLMKSVSETRGTLVVGPPQESWSKEYFTFDVTQPNSLELIVTGWMYDFYDHPPRYEYIRTTGFIEWKTGSAAQEHIPCTFILYDEAGVHNFELGYDCLYSEVKRTNTGYFYIRADGNPASASTLVHLDTDTGLTADIVTDEIEKIESISPDGRYVALVLDNSSIVDAVDFFTDLFYWEGMIPHAQLAIYDLVNREYIYILESYAGGIFTWPSNDRLILQTFSVAQPPTDTVEGSYRPGSIQLLKLDFSPVETVTIEGIESDSSPIILSGEERILVYTLPDSLSIIDFTLPSVMPLITDEARQSYDIGFEKLSSDGFAVTVKPKPVDGRDSSYMMRYTIAEHRSLQ